MSSFRSQLSRFSRELERKLDRIPSEVSFGELFTPAFMREHTTVPTFEALIVAGGFDANTVEDFLAIRDDAWERTVRDHTSFPSWEAMQRQAGNEFVARRLRG